MSGSFKVIYADNPFDLGSRTIDLYEADGRTLAEVLEHPLERYSIYKDAIIEEDFTPVEGDEIVVVLIPLGGDEGGKGILRLVAFAALAATTGPVGTAIFGAPLTGAGAVAFSLGYQIAGAALINGLLPIIDPEEFSESPTYGIDGAKPTSREGTPVPLCYGKYRHSGNLVGAYIDQVDSRTQYVTLLMCLGEAPIADVTDVYLNNQPIENYKSWSYAIKLGRDVARNQVGPVWWDRVAYAEGVEGVDRAEVTPSIDEVITPVNINVRLAADDPDDAADNDGWLTRTTTKTVDRFRLDLAAPAGLAFYEKKKNLRSHSVKLEVQYRRVGATAWTNLAADLLEINSIPVVYVYDDGRVQDRLTKGDRLVGGERAWSNDRAAIWDVVYVRTPGRIKDSVEIRTFQKVGYAYRGDKRSTEIALIGKDTAPLRFSLNSPVLTEDFYEIRIRRVEPEWERGEDDFTIVDRIQLTDINEIETEKVGYQGSAMIAVKALLTDQVNSVPEVSVLDHGREISVWNGGPDQSANWVIDNSDNPAWVAWDILTSELGAGRSADELNLLAWKRWADFCEDNDLHFRGVFDTGSNIWDSVKQVFRAGRAQIIPTGTSYTVAIEGPTTPVMTFGNGNIIEGSLKYTWVTTSDRANEIEIVYHDEDEDYRERSIKVVDSDRIHEPQKVSSLKLLGITTQERAVREGRLQLNLNSTIRQTVNFQAPLEAIGVSVGDVILVAHDYALWSYSGRVELYTAPQGTSQATIKLDQEVVMEPGYDYSFLLHSPYSELGTEVVSEKAADNMAFRTSGYNPIGYIPNLVASYSGVDYPIIGYSLGWYHVDRPITLDIVGGSVKLYQTDHLETVDVVGVTTPVQTDTLTLLKALGTYDETHTDVRTERNFMFGAKENVGKEFRVKRISVTGDEQTRALECTEYSEQAFVDSEIIVVEPTVNLLPNHITSVQDLTSEQSYRVVDGKTVVNVSLSWGYPITGLYEGAEIIGSVNGGDVKSMGRATSGIASWEGDFDLDDYVVLRVIAFDKAGRRAPVSSSPFEAIFLNETASMPAPATPTVTVTGSDVTLSWAYPSELSGTEDVEIYRGPTVEFDEATLVLETANPLTTYKDQIAPGATVYYWIRFRLVNRIRALSGFAGPLVAQTEGLVSGSKTFTANSDEPPTATGIGDLWYQPDTGVTRRTSDGVNWDEEFDSRYAYLPDSSPLPDPNFNLSAALAANGEPTPFWTTEDVTAAQVIYANQGQDDSGSARIETFSNTAAKLTLTTKQYFPANGTDVYHAKMIYTAPTGLQIPNFDFGMRFYDKDRVLLESRPVSSVVGSGGVDGEWTPVAPNTAAKATGTNVEKVAYVRPYLLVVGNSTTNKEMTISSIEFEKAKDSAGILDNAITDLAQDSVVHTLVGGTATGNLQIHYPVQTPFVQVPQGFSGHYAEVKLNFSARAVTGKLRLLMSIEWESNNNGTWTNFLGPNIPVEHFIFSEDGTTFTDVDGLTMARPAGYSNSHTVTLSEPPAGPLRARLAMVGTNAADDWTGTFDALSLSIVLFKK